MTDLLAPGGGLERAIPFYEDRAEQRAMSAAVAHALAESRPLIVEAGTGTGKTLAYLVPALESGKRVVVSTGTRALQDQIARHDIPLLSSILAKPFSAVVLKGVSNYVCRRKLDEARHKAGPDVSLAALMDWSAHSETGDRAEVEWLTEDAPVWSAVTTTTDARIGPRCPYFERCFVTQARRLAERSQLILVNHALYLADRALRATHPGARLLPDHDAVIFDEAHQLPDIATEHFGVRISTHRLAELVRDANLALAGMPLWTGRAAMDTVHAVERASIALFSAIRPALIAADGSERMPLPPGLFEKPERQTRWFELDTALEELARMAETDGEAAPDEGEAHEDQGARAEAGSRAALTGVARRAREVRNDLATLAEQRQRSHVYWGEARATGTTLAASPIDVAELFRRRVILAGPTPIFTSATLTAAGTFTYTRARLGLEDATELHVASPFDYARQALLYVPCDLPLPTDDTFSAATAARTLELLAITEGRAFLLFTSHRGLRNAAAALANLPYPRFVQGDAPRATLIDRFRATPNAVLLGTASFWEGVDVPGDALSLVVIDKLPFAPHTEPLVAARMAACAATGADPFATIQVPSAAIALKQGFGRLIRRRDDRGIVAILDGRIVTRTYGRTFLDTLPEGLPRTSALEQVRRWWKSPVAEALDGLRGDPNRERAERIAATGHDPIVTVEIDQR
ncbi:MAG: ATP-dependent DNA helicase [Deltaproteobacteria bacterium]|nr:ATP-dependent DNA helicase [Deltaproteobacteria bacterium]